jgi:HSP20 family protein
MAIVRWEPFRDLVATQDRFNRLFNEAFSSFFGDEGVGTQTWALPVDIYETDDSVILTAEVPGVDPKDVDVRIEGNTLYLSGERKLDSGIKEENYRRMERAYGPFSRSFTLPASINPDKVNAEYSNGVLTLTMPKREEAKPKTIKILASKN